MEILEQLEQRIGVLLSRIEALSSENNALRNGRAQEMDNLADENRLLREELEKERTRNSEACSRVEALVARIKEHTDQE